MKYTDRTNARRVGTGTGFTSQLCSDQYGDAVHLSRSLVSIKGDDVYYDTFDGCNDAGYTSPRSLSSDELIMNVSPNPTAGQVSIDFGREVSGALQVYSLTGLLLESTDIIDSRNTSLMLEFGGVHFIKFVSDNGDIITKKIISIR